MSAALELPYPWEPLTGDYVSTFEDEYAAEIAKGHPLYGVPAKALAYFKLEILFRLFRHECAFAVVELTRSGREEPAPENPACRLFRDDEQLLKCCLEPAHNEWMAETRELIHAQGHFFVCLTPESIRHHYVESAPLPAHELILCPLLNATRDCWVYGLRPDSPILQQSSRILRLEKGKHRVLLSEEPILGHELLWNACTAKRGSILMLCPVEAVRTSGVFRHCYRPNVWSHLGVGHTPSAIRNAKQAAQDAGIAAVCFSRTNGLEWMDIIAAPDVALSLFDLAWSQHVRENRLL